MIIKMLAFVFLLLESIEDIRFRALALNKLIMWGTAGIVVKYILFNEDLQSLVMEVVLGGMVLCVCWISKEAIGYGDGVVIFITCIICGIHQTVLSCMISFGVFLVAAVFTLFRKGFKRNLSIPYVPCLFLGYLGGLLI